MDESLIYLVEVFNPAPAQRSRLWGFYHEAENARECVRKNWSDISELGYYRYGIVIAIGPGPLAISQSEEWFEFKWKNNTLVSVDPVAKPEGLPHGLGF